MSEFRDLMKKLEFEKVQLFEKTKELDYQKVLLIKHQREIESIEIKKKLTEDIIKKLEETVKYIHNNVEDIKHKVDFYIENR